MKVLHWAPPNCTLDQWCDLRTEQEGTEPMDDELKVLHLPEFNPDDAMVEALRTLLPDYWKRTLLARDLVATLDKLGWELKQKPQS